MTARGPRLAGLMTLVGITGLGLAALARPADPWATAVPPACLTALIAASLASATTRRRPFWLGFAAGGVLMGSLSDRFGVRRPVLSGSAILAAGFVLSGLSGSIWTRELGRALRVSRGIESGNLSVNSHSSVRYWTPFGGFKSSGLGRELGPDAPFAFTETKNVFISTKEN